MRRLNPKKAELIAKGVLLLFAGTAVLALVAIVGYVVVKGIGVINLEFLFGRPRSMGREGGILPFIIS